MTWDSSKLTKIEERGDFINMKLVLLGILLLVGLTFGGCVAVGGYGYVSSFDSYHHYGSGYSYRDNHRDWTSHRERDGHRSPGSHRESWDGSRRWR